MNSSAFSVSYFLNFTNFRLSRSYHKLIVQSQVEATGRESLLKVLIDALKKDFASNGYVKMSLMF